MTDGSHFLRRLLLSLTVVAAALASSGATESGAQDVSQTAYSCKPQPATPEASSVAATTAIGTWTELAEMPRQRSELGAAAIGDTIYIVGGFGGGAMLDCYHPATGTWGVGADMPVAVHHPGVTALDGRLYVAGGYTETGATDAVWAYDPSSNTWEARAPLPEPRGALGLAAVDGRLYAIGGAVEQLGGPVTGAVDVYDPSTDSWEPRASLPTPREHLAVAAGDGRIYAIGGRANGNEGEQVAGAAEAYDPATDQWASLPALPTPRGGFAGLFVAGQVVVLGGERGTTTFAIVEAYDPSSGTWRELPPMPTARHGVAGVAIDDTIYAIAGSTRAGTVENTGANEAFRLAPN